MKYQATAICFYSPHYIWFMTYNNVGTIVYGCSCKECNEVWTVMLVTILKLMTMNAYNNDMCLLLGILYSSQIPFKVGLVGTFIIFASSKVRCTILEVLSLLHIPFFSCLVRISVYADFTSNVL